MNDFPYSIWRDLTRNIEGGGENYNVFVRAKAKFNKDNPFEVPNELIALRLGLAIGLPIPIGFPLLHSGQLYYASLNAAGAEENFPPATKSDIEAILRDERLACGIIVFDSWILNADRWRSNIAYDDETGKTFIYDHGGALFTGQGPEMEKNRNSLGIGNHCLSEIRSLMWFDHWHEAINAISLRYIRDSVTMAANLGLPKEDVQFVGDFLIDRRLKLKEIFKYNYKTAFKYASRNLLDPFLGDFEFDYCI